MRQTHRREAVTSSIRSVRRILVKEQSNETRKNKLKIKSSSISQSKELKNRISQDTLQTVPSRTGVKEGTGAGAKQAVRQGTEDKKGEAILDE
ncbi:hypothetical protein SDJN03_18630, partial [Cucurbita argyrosperma subsp. sororia]